MSDDESLSRELEQDLSDRDQTSADADQSSADLDQTSADVDQGASARDQAASNRDQRASEDDQAASDEQAETRQRAETRRVREENTHERAAAAMSRAETSELRDATAKRRDEDAERRDASAIARDRLATALDAEIDRLQRAEGQSGSDSDPRLRAAHDRERAAAGRARAAVNRERAAQDRALARQDRERAAADRLAAAAELAAEGIDELTGALRRRVGQAAIQRELDRTRRTAEPLVLAFVDVDGLKAVNDTHGHAAGDALLRSVAECIRLALRPYDVIMRVGGDEFVCSLSGQNSAGVGERFEVIAKRIAATQDGATITVGLVEHDPDEPLDALISRADHAMMARREGRFAMTKSETP